MGSALYLSQTEAKDDCDPLRFHTLQSSKCKKGWKPSAIKKEEEKPICLMPLLHIAFHFRPPLIQYSSL